MTLEEALKVLDSMASGYHPDTGEPLPISDVSNSRSAIRALQIAIDYIRNTNNSKPSTRLSKTSSHSSDNTNAENASEQEQEEIDIYAYFSDDRMFEYLQEFKNSGFNPTVARVGKCLVGTQAKSVYQYVKDFSFYGILEGLTTYSKIKPVISNFFERYEAEIETEFTNINKPWEEIDFFEQSTFNTISPNNIQQLKRTIGEIPIKRTLSNLTAESMLIARKIYPRAYEPWEQQENELLLKTLRYTNDLDLLSEIFQRGQGAVRSQGQRLLYQIAVGGR